MSLSSIVLKSGVVGSILAVGSDVASSSVVRELGGLSTISVASVLGVVLLWEVKRGKKKDALIDYHERENKHLRKHLSATYKELYKRGYEGDGLMSEFDPDTEHRPSSKD